MPVKAEVREVIALFRKGLEEIFGERLKGLILFGSQARGEVGEGSNIELLMLLDRADRSWEKRELTAALRADLNLDTGELISSIYMTPERYARMAGAFEMNVHKEGVYV